MDIIIEFNGKRSLFRMLHVEFAAKKRETVAALFYVLIFLSRFRSFTRSSLTHLVCLQFYVTCIMEVIKI